MPRPRPRLALCALAAGAAFAAWRGAALLPAVGGDGTPWGVRLFLLLQWLVEALFAFGISGTTALAVAYLCGRRAAPRDPARPPAGARVAVLYLCCGDLDRPAVESLVRLRHDGPLELWIHDDLPGGDPSVDALVRQVGDRLPVHLLRRAAKTGGKPGAINFVLEQMRGRADFVLLCDNDSIAADPDCLAGLLAPMDDPAVAVVQARNVPVVEGLVCTMNRLASRAIDVFHLFLSVGSRHGWTPFVGHNALLRVAAVEEVGGMQPGCFADDIDLTLRLQLAGHRVHYAAEVRFGERHPPTYAAFRKRAYKWACGSSQVLRRWTPAVLRSRRLSLAEKWGFLQFLGFYPLQTLALAYTAMTFLVAPLLLSRAWFPPAAVLLAGALLPLLIFLPVLAFALRHRWWRDLPGFLATCWLCYGAADFPTARGVLHGLSQRVRRWVPTNSVRGGADGSMLIEALFGVAILVVPLVWFPELLLAPLTFLVAAKFLLLPTVGELYQDGVRRTPRRLRRLPLLRVVAVLGCTGLLLGQEAPRAQPDPVSVRGDQLLVAGAPYVVKGVHYGPWRPGTGPGRSDYPAQDLLAEDLHLLAGMHVNTIFTFDPPRRLLDVAWQHRIRVLCGFWLEWPQFASPAFAAMEDTAVAAVERLCDHPAVLGWVLGNEIPSWVIAQHTAAAVEERLRVLYGRVRAADPGHPVTHANWPTARTLDLSFFDVCAFNVYALWPPEVVARGYESFVREVVAPLAGGRPLLITEYGANSLEAGESGQARLLGECWEGLRAAGAVGGFAFEFADEWWKNYSNPKMAGAWWDREPDMQDHLRHDQDPEEHYGLFDSARRPKPASRVLAALYGGAAPPDTPPSRHSRLTAAVSGAVGAALVLFLLARAMRARHRAAAAAGGDQTVGSPHA